MNKEFIIEVYSHGVYIHGLDVGAIARFTPFINGLELREDVDEWDPALQKNVSKNVVKKRFFVATPGRKSFHIHRNMLDELLEEMRSAGLTQYKRIDHEPVDGDTVSSFEVKGKTPRDYQEKIIDAIVNNQYTCGVKLKTGGGKAHVHGTNIRTPSGWKTIESCKVDDEVIAGDGSVTKITGVYPQGERECFIVTFADGRQAEVSDEHLWRYYDIDQQTWYTDTTRALSHCILEKDIGIPLAGLDKLPDVKVKPGTNFKRLGEESVEQLPKDFEKASGQQRMELLRGILSNGFLLHPTKGSITVMSCHAQFAKDLQRLAWSLGGECTLDNDNTTVMWFKDIKGLVNSDDVMTAAAHRKWFTLQVMSIAPSATKKEATCISVAHPSRLYQMENYLVTHNTFCALAAMERLKVRTCLMLLPKYFGIWDEAFQDIYGGVGFTTIEVSGSGNLKKLMVSRKNGEKIADVIKISVPTYRNYIKCYEQRGMEGLEEEGYLVPPHEFHSFMGIGLQINDEIQDDPGFYFKSDTVTNVKKQVYLSATPYTGNDRLSEMINVMLPRKTDAPLPGLDAYANCIGMYYQDNCRPGDYKGFKGAYSHMTYEAGLLRDAGRRNKYFKMVADLVKKLYINEHQPGQKIIVFCATVKFILKLVKHLQHEFKDFKVGEYVSGTDYKELLLNDITVTTLKSAGAGVDIPNVKEILLLHAINSKRDNIQALGRGRRLKDFPDINPRFTFLASITIPEHLRYAKQKEIYFHKRIRSLKYYRYG